MASVKEVKAVAALAKLRIPADKEAAFTEEFNAIVAMATELNALDTEGVEPMCSVHGAVNVFRADETTPSLDTDTVLNKAPAHNSRCFAVPLVIETENS